MTELSQTQRYDFVRQIAQGGQGVVYEVIDRHSGERLALKTITVAARDAEQQALRVEREAQVMKLIDSVHVPKFVASGVLPELAGAPFIAMELLRGETLEQLLQRRGHLARAEVARLLSQVAEPVKQAHQFGFVHRDLKPSNVFLHEEQGDHIVKLLDFGLSKDVGASITHTGLTVGTARYMAPEQVQSSRTASHAVDIWAIGMIAFELLTGQAYWSGGNIGEVIAQLMHDAIEPPSLLVPGLEDDFDRWFLRSCQRDPLRRFATIDLQITELQVILGQVNSASVPR